MNIVARRGACPALSAPMQTGDGLLVRLNPVAGKDGAGGLAPDALIGLCESAARHGNGIVEVTARGSIQIRGLTAASAVLLAGDVNRLGIETRTGVPVETGPLAGIDPDEIADPRPLAEAIRSAIAEAGLSRLGPKVSVVVDGGGHLTLDDVLADVRLAAVRREGGILWHLSVGGSAETAWSFGMFAEDEACRAALQILQAVAELGREARARDVSLSRLENQIHPLSATLRAAPLPRSGGEDGSQAGRPSATPRSGGEVSREARRRGGLPDTSAPIGILRLANPTHALLIALPFGSQPAEALIDLAKKAHTLGATEIRPAPRRSLILLGLSRPDCEILLEEAERLGFVTDPADPRLSISACPGAPSCASGQLATRDIATDIAQTAPDLFDGSFALHVSGCAKGCAHPAPAALTLVGGENGAGLVVDGAAKDLPAGYMPSYEAAKGLSRVARLVRNDRMAGETSAACLARLGAQHLATAFTQDRA